MLFRGHVAALMAAMIVVRFDGSMRLSPPDGTRRVATAAATVASSTDDKASDIFLIGGQHLDTNDYKTSGEAEFGGLILGLQGLLLAHNEKRLAPLLQRDDAQVGDCIEVQGDCKTAIQQMQGRSRSRKLGHLSDKAYQLMEEIPYKLQFEHIPREENVLCDGICTRLVLSRQERTIESVCDSMLEIIDATDSIVAGQSLHNTLEQYLLPPTTILPGSLRVKAYSILGRLSWIAKDYALLYELAQRIRQLAKAPRPCSSSSGDADTEMVPLHHQGIQYEISALRKLGNEKEAGKVIRREKTFRLSHGSDDKLFGHVGLIDNDGAGSAVTTSLSSLLKHEVLQWTQDGKAAIASKLNDIRLVPLTQETCTNEDDVKLDLLEKAVCGLADRASSGLTVSHVACWMPVE